MWKVEKVSKSKCPTQCDSNVSGSFEEKTKKKKFWNQKNFSSLNFFERISPENDGNDKQGEQKHTTRKQKKSVTENFEFSWVCVVPTSID